MLAEDMLQKHRATRTETAGKGSSGRKRKAAPARVDDKPARPPATRKTTKKSD